MNPVFNLDIIGSLLLLVVGVNLVYGIYVFFSDRRGISNRIFFGVVLSVTAWCASMIFYRGFHDLALSTLFARYLYAVATIIPFIFLYFSFTFPEERYKFSWWQKWLIPILPAIVVFVSLMPGFLVKSVIFTSGEENIIVFDTGLHLLYAFYIVNYFGWAYLNLYLKYRKTKGVVRAQTSFVILGTLVSTIIGVVTNLVLPLFGIFAFNWAGQVAVVVMVALISYAILKHHLFSVRVVTAELFTFALWGAVLVRVLASNDAKSQLGDFGLLIATVILGVFLIRGVRKEVESREHIEKLAGDLELANTRLQELDRQKSEFVSIASHQLRSPLTAIKGYSSMILEGSFGEIGDKVRGAVDRVFQSSQTLVVVIENFLNLSRIEQGRMSYEFAPVDMRGLAKQVVDQLSLNASKKSLNLSYAVHPEEPESSTSFTVKVDKEKMRQVLLNLLDNSIKYTPSGSVRVLVELGQPNGVRVTIADTGIGMSKATQEKLFKKFSRADGAGKINAGGAGLGLFLAAELMHAHNGKIWAESDGEGKGSRFIIQVAPEPQVAK